MIKKNIKIANSSDIKFLFNLYNKGISGGFFKKKKEISYDQHKSWFSEALNSNNLKNYILFYKSNKIGYIRFQLINKRSVTVSIIIMKKYRKLGLGSYYLGRAFKKAKKLNIKKIYAEVLQDNNRSRLFFENNNFKRIKYPKEFQFLFNKKNCIYLKNI